MQKQYGLEEEFPWCTFVIHHYTRHRTSSPFPTLIRDTRLAFRRVVRGAIQLNGALSRELLYMSRRNTGRHHSGWLKKCRVISLTISTEAGALGAPAPRRESRAVPARSIAPQPRTDLIYERIKAEQQSIDWDRGETNRLYKQIRAEAATKKRGNSDIEEDVCDNWERRGRPVKRRNWYAQDDTSTISISTEASPYGGFLWRPCPSSVPGSFITAGFVNKDELMGLVMR